MACCISFGAVSRKLLIPILGGLVTMILKFIITESRLSKQTIMLSICSSLGMSLSFIPYLIMIIRTKTKKQKILESLMTAQTKSVPKFLTIDYEYNDRYQAVTYDKFKYIFLAAFIDFFQTLLTFFVYTSISFNFWILDIIIISSVSSFIFGTKLYGHQKLSLITIIIFGLLLDLYNNFIKGEFKNFDLFCFFIKIINEIFFSFLVITQKYLIEKKFVSPYEICFFEGLIPLFFYSIIIAIVSFFPVSQNSHFANVSYNDEFYFDHFLAYFKDIEIYEIFYFIGFMFVQLGINLSLVFTVRYFSPTHILITLVIGKSTPYIKKMFDFTNGVMISSFIPILAHLILFFILLVYNEVIELNCFRLQKNTFKNMEKRAIKEYLQELDNKSEDASGSTGSYYKSFDIGDSNGESNMDEYEDIEEKDLETIEPKPIVCDPSK